MLPAVTTCMSHPGGHCEHICTCVHTPAHSQRPAVTMSTGSDRNKPNSSGSKYAVDQAFLAISAPLSSPSPARKDYVSLLFLHCKIVVVVGETIQQEFLLHQALHMALCTHFLK